MIQLFNILKTKQQLPDQIITDSWEDRSRILEDNTNLFAWKRSLDGAITDYLKKTVEDGIKPIRETIGIDNLEKQIKEIHTAWNHTLTNNAQVFWQDVYMLARDFLLLSNASQATLHLRLIADDACTKFHTDGYHLRLFTTYLGQGTEWLPENAVNRAALGKSNYRIVKNRSKIQRMAAGEVGILKGEVPSVLSPCKGIVHRSPQIKESNEKRIILRIDL